MSELYIGLMSGTSLDGIDAALVEFTGDKIQLVDFVYQPFDDAVKQRLQRLSDADALISLKDYGALDCELAQLFAQTVQQLLTQSKTAATAITAIGSHGLTVHHAPTGNTPFSLQIADPNIIAEQTGITTVADFRRRDIAAGGQGAPLVPAFHHVVFNEPDEPRCIVNIGGIANITVLDGEQVLGFDTGTGNTLMDSWIKLHRGLDYDKNGAWAKTGHIDVALVEVLKQDPYFTAAAPKSTGKEYFSLAWLAERCDVNAYRPEDMQASLCYFTAITICEAIQHYAPNVQRVLVCGGGIHNQTLIEHMYDALRCSVLSTANYGIHPDHVEAMAFAWLARQTLARKAGNLKAVTGARRNVVLGGIYLISR